MNPSHLFVRVIKVVKRVLSGYEKGIGYVGGVIAMLSYTLPYTFDSPLLDELYFKGSCLGIALLTLKLFIDDRSRFRSLLFVASMFFCSVFVMTTVNFVLDSFYDTKIGVELVMGFSVLCVIILLLFYVFRWK